MKKAKYLSQRDVDNLGKKIREVRYLENKSKGGKGSNQYKKKGSPKMEYSKRRG